MDDGERQERRRAVRRAEDENVQWARSEIKRLTAVNLRYIYTATFVLVVIVASELLAFRIILAVLLLVLLHWLRCNMLRKQQALIFVKVLDVADREAAKAR